MMLPLLAIEASPEMITAAVVLSGLVVLVTAANALIDFWRKINGTDKDKLPQPVRVQAEDDVIRRREFEEHKAHISRVHAELKQANAEMKQSIGQEFRELREERKESIINLHKHIGSVANQVQAEVSQVVARELKGEVERLDDRITERLKEGNHTMVEHGERLVALERDHANHSSTKGRQG